MIYVSDIYYVYYGVLRTPRSITHVYVGTWKYASRSSTSLHVTSFVILIWNSSRCHVDVLRLYAGVVLQVSIFPAIIFAIDCPHEARQIWNCPRASKYSDALLTFGRWHAYAAEMLSAMASSSSVGHLYVCFCLRAYALRLLAVNLIVAAFAWPALPTLPCLVYNLPSFSHAYIIYSFAFSQWFFESSSFQPQALLWISCSLGIEAIDLEYILDNFNFNKNLLDY